jgi:hypothetical protein
MDFAKRARGQQPPSARFEQEQGPAQQPVAEQDLGQDGRLSSVEEQQARRRIMDFARGVNGSRGLTAGVRPAESPSQPQTLPAEPGQLSTTQSAAPAPAPATASHAVSNSLLAQLHAERMARRQQEAQPGEVAGAGAAEAAGRPASHRAAEAPAAGIAAWTAAASDRSAHQRQQQQQNGPGAAAASDAAAAAPASISLLTYNLW